MKFICLIFLYFSPLIFSEDINEEIGNRIVTNNWMTRLFLKGCESRESIGDFERRLKDLLNKTDVDLVNDSDKTQKFALKKRQASNSLKEAKKFTDWARKIEHKEVYPDKDKEMFGSTSAYWLCGGCLIDVLPFLCLNGAMPCGGIVLGSTEKHFSEQVPEVYEYFKNRENPDRIKNLKGLYGLCFNEIVTNYLAAMDLLDVGYDRLNVQNYIRSDLPRIWMKLRSVCNQPGSSGRSAWDQEPLVGSDSETSL